MQIRRGIPILILIILLLIPFHRVLTGRAYLTSVDSFLPYVEPYASKFPDARTGPGTFACRRDGLLQTIPSKHFTQENLRNGRFPLWNPYIFCGTPHQADMYSQLFAVTDTPFLYFMSVDAALTVATLLKLLLLGLGMYFVAQRFNIRWEFACISAIIIVFNFQQMQWLEIPAFLSTSLYLPWIFLAWDKFLTTKRISWIFITALLGGLSGLGGQGQIYATIWIILFIYSLWGLGQSIVVNRFIRTIALIFAFFLSVAVAWVQFYPAMEFVLLSKGDESNPSAAHLFITSAKGAIEGGWMQIPINILRLFAPYSYHEVDSSYYSIYKELVVYLGLLSPAVILALWRRKRPPFINYLWWVCVISLLLIIFNTVSETVFGIVPFTRFQNLRRMLALVFNFNMAILIPFVFQTIIQNIDEKLLRRLSSILLCCIIPVPVVLTYIALLYAPLGNLNFPQVEYFVVFYVYAVAIPITYLIIFRKRFLSVHFIPFIILLLFFLEMWNYSSHLIIISNVSSGELAQAGAGLKCEENKESGRIFRINPYSFEEATLEGFKRIYWPNTGMLAGLYDAQGYNPLNIFSYRKLLVSSREIEPGNPREIPDNPYFPYYAHQNYDDPIWPLLNVNWMLRFGPQLVPYKGSELYIDEMNLHQLYPVSTMPKGWARVYFGVRHMPQGEFYAGLKSLSLYKNLNKYAYITKGQSNLPELSPTPPPDSTAAMEIEHLPGNIKVTINALDHPAILVASENNYPGWRVEVDGKTAELLTVDGTFLGVQLDAGSHKIEFTFDPPRFRIGLIVSIISLIMLILGLAVTTLIQSNLTKPQKTRKIV
jgi:hypothetical protein